VKVTYRHAARDDVIRQFRYYLITMAVPEVAVRFRAAVKLTVQSLRQHPLMAPRFPLRNSRFQDLRSWPVAGFEAIRIYYLSEPGFLRVIRILHEKRDVRRILERDQES
jgi:plasmid stabilization system protein ParE